ncbi:VENN motif pre-toxin domain-containing protein [Serratia liquefaciens]|uniref:VENN motif pre-toxin domain-containing protein n=1 Tax=Serratia liquefaciens TaxID=614 RepID=UPI002FEF5C1C
MVIRDGANQQQDVNALSRDTDNANGSIGPIFDKEKEQNRLKQAQLIGEIAGQTMDIVRTQGDINGLQKAKDKHPGLDAKALRKTPEYQAEMQKYGTGSDMQRAAQAVTGALQALAGNNLAGALASGAAPYLAKEIKARVGENNVAANAMAHALLGAITAQLNNQSAVAGAVGAGGGELAARVIVEIRFPGRDISSLTEGEKQEVSALSQLAAGLAGGIASDSTAGAVAASQAGKNAVENNFVAVPAPVPPPVALPKTSINGAGGNEAWDADDGSDPSKSREENARQPNVAKELTDAEKAEAGGTGSGTPGGWEPQDEENARNQEALQNGFSKDKLNQAASAPNRNGLTDAGRALQKHGGRDGSVYSYTSQKAAVLNQEAQAIVNDILNNPSTKVETRVVFENKELLWLKQPLLMGVLCSLMQMDQG